MLLNLLYIEAAFDDFDNGMQVNYIKNRKLRYEILFSKIILSNHI